MTPVVFRFDAAEHVYTVDGAPVPHITGMLERTGWIDDRWYTEESCDRGQAVHELTAACDLGALTVSTCESPYRGWLLAHQAAMILLRPTFLAIEEPDVHPHHRFGGRPDRVLELRQAKTILEIKTGGIEKAHAVQTALQAILVAGRGGLHAEAYQRYAIYYRPNGRYRLEPHDKPQDFDEAYRIIQVCCQQGVSHVNR